MSPQPVDRRIPQLDVLALLKEELKESPSMVTTDGDECKNGHTEERGCSPITVLEGRAAEGAVRSHSGSGAHTVTTTTSWGAPVSTTTSIQVLDSIADNCVQLTLHSKSHVTLHAPEKMGEEQKNIEQHDRHIPCSTGSVYHSGSEEETYSEEADSKTVLKEMALSGESNFEGKQDTVTKGSQCITKELCNEPKNLAEVEIPARDNEGNLNRFSINQQIPSNVECKDITVAAFREISGKEKGDVSIDEAPRHSSFEDDMLLVCTPNTSVLPELEKIKIMHSSDLEEVKAVCDNSLVLEEDYELVSECLAPSAHRPTTLMITSNSNESTDDAECKTNDPADLSEENEKLQDFKQETGTVGVKETAQHHLTETSHAATGNERISSESGAISRPERPSRPAPRTTTLVKVKVEKRPIGSHPPVRERSSHEHQTIVHVPSVEEEVRGLMQEVKEATSQIKQEVKELRQADTPTPDTPTPLREFREFLNREEEQEQERLPTIKEMCRESEEDASLNTGGERLKGNKLTGLDLGPLPLEDSTPGQFVHPCFQTGSGYSTLGGYFVGTAPSSSTKYIPLISQLVPEESSSELSIKSELESPSSFVESSDVSPVESVCSVTSPGNEKQGKSKFKSFIKKVRQLTSKGQYIIENSENDCQGIEPPKNEVSREFSSRVKCTEGNWETDIQGKFSMNEQPLHTVVNVGFSLEKESNYDNDNVGKETGSVDFSGLYPQKALHVPVASSSVMVLDDNSGVCDKGNGKNDNSEAEDKLLSESELEFHATVIPITKSYPSHLQCSNPITTVPSLSDHSSEGISVFEKDYECKGLREKTQILEFTTSVDLLRENISKINGKPGSKQTKENATSSRLSRTLEKVPLSESVKPLNINSSSALGEKDSESNSPHRETCNLLEPLIEEDETEDTYELSLENKVKSDNLFAGTTPSETTVNILEANRELCNRSLQLVSNTEIEDENWLQVAASSINQNFEIGRETIHQISLSEDLEDMHEVTEMPSATPKYITATTSVHQAEYPQKAEIIHRILENLSLQENEMHDDTWNKGSKARDIEYGLQNTDIFVTEMASHISEVEAEQEVDALSEMQPTDDMNAKTENLVMHYGLEKDDCSAVTFIEKPLSPVFGQVVHIPLEKTDKKKDVNFEKGHCEVHSDDGQHDFQVVNVNKEKVYYPLKLENIALVREVETDFYKAKAINLPSYSIEKASITLHEGHDPVDSFRKDVTRFFICQPYDIRRAAQVHEVKTETEKTTDYIPLHVNRENASTVSHGQLSTISEYHPPVSQHHKTNETKQILVTNKDSVSGNQVTSTDLSMWSVGDENSCIVHEDKKTNVAEDVMISERQAEKLLASKYQEDKCSDTAVTNMAVDGTRMVAQPPVILTEIGKTEDLIIPSYNYERSLAVTHEGQELEDFEIITINKEEMSEGCDVSKLRIDSSEYQIESEASYLLNTEKEDTMRDGVYPSSITGCGTHPSDTVFEHGSGSDQNMISVLEAFGHVENKSSIDEVVDMSTKAAYLCDKLKEVGLECERFAGISFTPEMELNKDSIESSEIFCEKMKSEASVVSNDSEKNYVLDQVSDELKHMISSLEYNIASGLSKAIEISTVFTRLECLEQEVANITKSFESAESSIPIQYYDVNKDDSISSPQSEPLSAKQSEPLCGEKVTSENFTESISMPVILGKESTNLQPPGGPSPTGEVNGVDFSEVLTDVEDLLSDGDHSPQIKRKSTLLVPQKDTGDVTDTEDVDFSGEEDEYIQEKNDLPTIQDLGLLPEPSKEVINLTEGYTRHPSPLLSGPESDTDDVEGRHKKNVKKLEAAADEGQKVQDETDAGIITDEENLEASGDEVEEATEVVEDSLPEHYMDQGEGISNKEKMTAVAPVPKVFLSHAESSDDEHHHEKKPQRKTKNLRVESPEGGITDVEDILVSDKGDETDKPVSGNVEAKAKPKKKKLVRRKVVKKPVSSKTLSAPTGDSEVLTDVEILTGDDEEEDGFDEDGETYLEVPELEEGEITDSEDVEASDTDDVETLLAKPVEKKEALTLPPPHAEKVIISETEEQQVREESGGDTDEEGFEIEDKEDERPLVPQKKISYEPLEKVEREALDIEEPIDPLLTDTEDFDMDDKDEDEILDDVMSRVPEEGEIYTIKELESNIGSISKTEMIRDINAEMKKTIKMAEEEGLTLQEALNEETLTDVEDLEEEKSKKPKRKQRKPDETDEESVNESDIEEEIPKPTKQGKKKGKRLPLAPQISEVRFIETEQGPLSIIVTPDTLEKKPDKVPKDKVANVVFLEKDEKENITDVEDLSDGEGEGKVVLKAPKSTDDPTTDTEDLDFDPSEVDRPLSPLPPSVERNVFSSPKRELIHIKEDKYGVPQVTIRKMEKDELLVSDVEEGGVTDTEDIEVSEGEALRIVGVTEDDTSDFELPSGGKIEVLSKMIEKERGLQVENDEDGGSTDVEELPMTKKQRRKPKSSSKLVPKLVEDSHTDVELLSDQDEKGNLKIKEEDPDAHTDVEDFEASDAEELEIPQREDAPTPDIIKQSAIKKVITLKEGPDGLVHTEESEVALPKKNILQVDEEVEGTTDIEDMEGSEAEDEYIEPEYPPVDLPCQEPDSVSISEKSSLPKSRNEAKHIKDNLLLPEDNYNNLTDVESLSEGEGNRCASNTDLLSSQQLTYAVESCTVAELSYHLPPTDPNLCVHPGVSLESDPFCGELTNPLVVEAELEQVYYHMPRDDAHENEVELKTSNGCVVRRRQVVASQCQAREIRRFWSLERNSPLHQSEINAFAIPTIHKKGFKTILYLEQPNLLDTISISDTLCNSGYFRNERILDFDSSSMDSLDDRFSYRDSDIVTVVDQFNQERGSSSFDDLPSPHLSSISSTGIVDSVCSGRSFSSDPSPQSPLFLSSYSQCSSEDLKKESSFTLSLSGISAPSCSIDRSPHQEVELSLLDVDTDENSEIAFSNYSATDNSQLEQNVSSFRPSDVHEQYHSACIVSENSSSYDDSVLIEDSDKGNPVLSHPLSELMNSSVQCEEFSSECIKECTSEDGHSLAVQSTQGSELDNIEDLGMGIQGITTDCIDTLQIKSLKDSFTNKEVDDTLDIKSSPTNSLQKSVTEWIVSKLSKESECKIEKKSVEQCKGPPKIYHSPTRVSDIQSQSMCVNKQAAEPSHQPALHGHERSHAEHLVITKSQSKSVSSSVNYKADIKETAPSLSIGSHIKLPLQSIKQSGIPFEDSGIHDYQASGNFTTSFDNSYKSGYDSDHVSLADSVLGCEDNTDRDTLCDVEKGLANFNSTQYLPTSQMSSSITQVGEPLLKVTQSPLVASLSLRHTLPRTFNKVQSEDLSSCKLLGSNVKDVDIISKDFGGVKELIDQWEVIVKEEQLRSLPASPAVGRKIIPTFDGSKKFSWLNLSGTKFSAKDLILPKSLKNSGSDIGTFDGGGSNVIEEVANVCDIIKQFEGRVGRLGKTNAHRQRLRQGSQSPASRSPSHHRRVATVKPLCEPQLHEENRLPLQEVQLQNQQQQQQELEQQEQFHELLEHTVSVGFVPRVLESLSITKCSDEMWEGNPSLASVSSSEGDFYFFLLV